MTKTKLLAATLLAMTACTDPSTPTTPSAPPKQGKAEIGAWGFDLAGEDTTVAPGASFFRHANGGWLKATTIPADKSNYGMFTVLADRSDERTKDIIVNAGHETSVEAKKVAAF